MKRSRSCTRCHHPMERKTVEHPYWHNSSLVALVQNVPCWTCSLCGHYALEPGVETTLKYIVKDYVKMGSVFPIPTTPYRPVILK